MKMIYISDNGYQGKYKDKCLIVYNNENSEVARYYKECSVQDVVEEIECFPGFLKSLHYRCKKNCEYYYNNACKLWHVAIVPIPFTMSIEAEFLTELKH